MSFKHVCATTLLGCFGSVEKCQKVNILSHLVFNPLQNMVTLATAVLPTSVNKKKAVAMEKTLTW